MKITCDRCKVSIKYKDDYLFNDGQFFGDNGDRTLFKQDEVICLHCIEYKKESKHECSRTNTKSI